MATQSESKELTLSTLKAACSTCSLRELCLPIGLNPAEVEQIDQIVKRRRPFKRGDHLYRAGTPFQSLYAIRVGFFKTCDTGNDGWEQITGFHMAGELLGLDAISTDIHTCNAVALEDSEICEIPFDRLEDLSRSIPSLQRQFHKMMSREITRDHGLMLLLGNMKAEERLATFLLSLSQRFNARGYSPTAFYLRMTREEIGNYLGLKLETVSRMFSKFQQQGLINVRHRYLELKDLARLKRVIECCGHPHAGD